VFGIYFAVYTASYHTVKMHAQKSTQTSTTLQMTGAVYKL